MTTLRMTMIAVASCIFVATLVPEGSTAAPRKSVAAQHTTPFAQKVFCLRNPQDCRFRPPGKNIDVVDGRVVGSAQRMDELARVNDTVNASIKPQVEKAGADHWQIGATIGDCEDYVLSKRKMLSDLGWPSSSTLMGRVRTARGELHAVLLVRTDNGTFVLDNLSSSIRPAKDAPYTWISVQSPDDPMQWQAASGAI